MVAVLTLTSADGGTARALVAEVERAAIARLDTEFGLSRAELQRGGNRAEQEDILKTWADYYVAAIHTMTDIEVGGSSKETTAAIESAATHVKQVGDERLAALAR